MSTHSSTSRPRPAEAPPSRSRTGSGPHVLVSRMRLMTPWVLAACRRVLYCDPLRRCRRLYGILARRQMETEGSARTESPSAILYEHPATHRCCINGTAQPAKAGIRCRIALPFLLDHVSCLAGDPARGRHELIDHVESRSRWDFVELRPPRFPHTSSSIFLASRSRTSPNYALGLHHLPGDQLSSCNPTSGHGGAARIDRIRYGSSLLPAGNAAPGLLSSI